jgi:hypothetical protein
MPSVGLIISVDVRRVVPDYLLNWPVLHDNIEFLCDADSSKVRKREKAEHFLLNVHDTPNSSMIERDSDRLVTRKRMRLVTRILSVVPAENHGMN